MIAGPAAPGDDSAGGAPPTVFAAPIARSPARFAAHVAPEPARPMLLCTSMAFTKIACPIDFSPCSQEALRVAVELAREGSGSLVLAHVWEPPKWGSGEAPIAPEVIQDLVDAEQAELEKWTAKAKQLGAREVAVQFLTGVAWDAIVGLLKRDPSIDLVVMGTHGRTGLKHVLIGSVAEKVVRLAPCPVLVVRDREDR